MTRSLVVGGSIGGLAAATALAAVGHDVTIAERRTSFDDGGAGILFHPEVIEAIGKLAPSKVITLPLRTSNKRREMSVTQSSQILFDSIVPSQLSTAAWIDLYRFLRHLAPDNVVHHNVDELNVLDDKVVSPTLGEFDTVILADGYHSTHRHLVSKNSEPIYNGCVLWRGLFELNQSVPLAVSEFFKDTFSVATKNPDHFVGYTIEAHDRDGLLANWGWYVEANYEQLSAWFKGVDGSFNARSITMDKVSKDVRTQIEARAKNVWPTPIREIVSHTVNQQRLFAAGIFHYRPTALAQGRIALVGDAGHTAVPITGAGAKHALLDALALHRSFSRYADPRQALENYQATRLQEVQELVDWGENWARRFQQRPHQR